MQEKIDGSLLRNEQLTREQITALIKHDLQMVHVTVSELLGNPRVLDVLTEGYWERYQALAKTEAARDEAIKEVNYVR